MSAVYPLEELPRFLGRCDYLVSVLPSTPGTRGLLDGDVLAACAPRRPALINVGRGDLVSEVRVRVSTLPSPCDLVSEAAVHRVAASLT